MADSDFAAGFTPSITRGLSRLNRSEGEEITNVMSFEQLDDTYYPGQ